MYVCITISVLSLNIVISQELTEVFIDLTLHSLLLKIKKWKSKEKKNRKTLFTI